MAVQHVSVIEHDVQRRHHGVGDAEIDEKVVGDGAHALVREDDPDDDEIATGRDDDHAGEQEGPDDLAPPRQDELVRVLVVEVGEARVAGRGRVVEELVKPARPGGRYARGGAQEEAGVELVAAASAQLEQRLERRGGLHAGEGLGPSCCCRGEWG